MSDQTALERYFCAVRELAEARAALLVSGFRCAEHPPVGRIPDTSCALYPACVSQRDTINRGGNRWKRMAV